MNFDLTLNLREKSPFRQLGGLLVNPATRLANAWATLVDPSGRI
ncbi:hypothetical protein P4S72_20765 [Vibrio sp. PP-XX7]